MGIYIAVLLGGITGCESKVLGVGKMSKSWK